MQKVDRILRTELVDLRDAKTKKGLTEKRKKQIKEAVNWKKGPTLEKQEKHFVDKLPEGIEVYFLKPGKEAFRKGKKQKPHDMTPCVGDVYKGAKFEDLWNNVCKVSQLDFELFKSMQVLIYRNAFMIDHKSVKNKIRYEPDEGVMNCIQKINAKIEKVLPEGGLLALLNFFDLLGWNEDVKYHTKNGKPDFPGKGIRVGRINTLLSTIRSTYQLSVFAKEVAEKSNNPQEIDWSKGTGPMQDLSRSGTCTPTNEQLIDWFSPLLTRKIYNNKSIEDFG